MTDIAELVKRLRDRDAPDGTVGWANATYPPQKVKDALCNQVADALEAQAKEIKIYQQTELTYITRVADVQREYSEMQAKLKARIAELDAALVDVTARLVAAVSLLERGGKKAAPSNRMFNQMIVDYKNCIERSRAALSGEM